MRRRDCAAGLRHWGNAIRVVTHEAIRLPVDARDARDGLRSARPMGSVGIGEIIGKGPDAEIRIVSDKRCRRRSLLGHGSRDTKTGNNTKDQK